MRYRSIEKIFAFIVLLSSGVYIYNVRVFSRRCDAGILRCNFALWLKEKTLFYERIQRSHADAMSLDATVATAAATTAAATTRAAGTARAGGSLPWDPDLREDEMLAAKEWLLAKKKYNISLDKDDDYFRESNTLADNCSASLRRVVGRKPLLQGMFDFNIPVLLRKGHFSPEEFDRLSKYRTPYGWKGMNRTDVEDAVDVLSHPECREMFPHRLPDGGGGGRDAEKCVRCAVVGNGGILNGSMMGEEIDSHDYVFRVNGAITAGFERDVGNRTSFYFFSTNTMKNSMRAYRKFGFMHPPWSKETRYVFVPCGHQDYYMVTAASRRAVVNKGPDKKDNFLPSTRLQTKFKDLYRPSTGAIALLTALHTCDQVSAYGFITSTYKHFPDHYYDQKQKLVFYANHDLNFERMLWKMLRKSQVMTLFQGKPPKKL
ncbi:alpha-N-acetylgalactosaminide alpha-2,6-sialyltransferase 2-like isoform X2 [Lethenteron reissneri]|uniref:alpha-N-acetylgalactosaminide alpha-2,6-sialyltransferase 2-like isoform X2 n=1 Tax=Lethenteron reissneri TaxID=7753 RepID=UPI002AB7ECE6|nr:alpha-N-acetylgalactosaminide alpha-2,6-sialyltransferase 2-like isoform X2 [Lethenteron reissneri]